MKEFSFQVTSRDKKTLARTGVINTAHGKIETPYLVPVATRGHVIGLTSEDLQKLPIQALLANTYHLHFMPPGDKEIAKKGGLHKVMSFSKPIFTDSGGFQALSLGIGKTRNLRKIGFFPGKNKIVHSDAETFAKMTEKGIVFTSVYNNQDKFMGPKESMEIQSNLGSDLIMAFDQCNCAGDSKNETLEAMERSHKWEVESLKYYDKKQALYGIIHGGTFKDLRLKSTKFITSLPFDGIAIGGSLGKTKKEMYELMKFIIANLKDDVRPRHLLGIGWVDDVFHGVSLGIDTFDCVQMTRVARHGELYISPKSGGNVGNKFHLSINKAAYAKDNKRIDINCKCYTCKNYTRKDLRELYKIKGSEYIRLATIHNIHFMLSLMDDIRGSIKNGTFSRMRKQWITQ